MLHAHFSLAGVRLDRLARDFCPAEPGKRCDERRTCARHTGGKAASGAASSRAEIVCRSGSARASPWHTHELGRSVCMCGTLLWPTELDPEHACVQTEVW